MTFANWAGICWLNVAMQLLLALPRIDGYIDTLFQGSDFKKGFKEVLAAKRNPDVAFTDLANFRSTLPGGLNFPDSHDPRLALTLIVKAIPALQRDYFECDFDRERSPPAQPRPIELSAMLQSCKLDQHKSEFPDILGVRLEHGQVSIGVPLHLELEDNGVLKKYRLISTMEITAAEDHCFNRVLVKTQRGEKWYRLDSRKAILMSKEDEELIINRHTLYVSYVLE
jgi:hypothetical protein